MDADSMKPVVVYGAEWCADCHRIQELLTARRIAYDYKDVDADRAAMDELLTLTDGRETLPTVKIGDNIMQDPKDTAVLQALGMDEPKPAETPKHDVVMVGAGPAALS